MKKHLLGSSSYQPAAVEGRDEGRGEQSTDEQFVQRKVKKIKYEMAHRGELSTINAHPRDTQLMFVEDGHYYKKEQGGRFRVSVSAIKGHFFAPFAQDDSIAMKFQFPQRDKDGKLILKNGRSMVGRSPKARMDPPDFGLTRKECVEKQRATSTYGTMIHAKAQRYLELQLDPAVPKARRIALFLQTQDFSDEDINVAKQVVEAELLWISEGWTIFRTEWSVFNEDFDLAGQIDVVLKRMNGLEAEYAVLDWKTTKFRMSSNFAWKADSKNAFYPFHEYQATLGTQYLVQMTLYAHILVAKYGMKVVMVRAIGLHKEKQLGESTTWKDVPFKEMDTALDIWKNFLVLEKMTKEWEETGLTAQGLFPTLTEPPFFKTLRDD